MDRIAQLAAKIRYHNRRYYDEDDPIISDPEYDALKEELRSIAPDCPALNEIGNPTFGQKAAHSEVMGSLTKCHTAQELVDALPDGLLTLMPKIDGCSIALRYDKGGLQLALTRGDGIVGEVVTPNATQISNIPLQIDHRDPIEVRGEAYIAKEDFYGIMDQPGFNKDHPDGLKNPRNAASGGLRQKNPKLTAERKIRFVAYKVIGEQPHSIQEDVLHWLELLGFETCPSWTCDKHIVESLIERVKEYPVPYDTDGIVAMYNDLRQFEDAGHSGNCPKGAIAYKFETEKKSAKVVDIVWETSRTGRVSPVAHIEPTEICGSTVRKITLHNYDWMRKLNIAIGDLVLFEKANEIIPEVVEILDRPSNRKEKIPSECPDCGEPLSRTTSADGESGADLLCDNLMCPSQVIKYLEFMLQTLDIKGIAASTIEKLMEHGLVEAPFDVFDLEVEDLMEAGFGPLSSTKIHKAVSHVEVTPARLLAALGIDGWGERMFEKLFEKSQIHGVDWIPALRKLSQDAWDEEFEAHIASMGETRAKRLFEALGDKWKLLDELLKRVKIKSATNDGPLAGMTFCITGTLSKPRKQVQQDIEQAGGIPKDSITKNLDYLVIGERAGSKLKQAEAAGVAVVSEDELYSMMLLSVEGVD